MALAAAAASASWKCVVARPERTGNVRMQHLGLELKATRSLRMRPPSDRRRCIVCMLPSGKSEMSSLEKGQLPNWAARSIKSFSMAELEARKMKYSSTGTECLLMGILTEGTSKASLYLRANGITLFKVRDETVEINGKSDMYYFSPEHPPLTESAQKALDWAVEEHQRSGAQGEISPTFILLGIWLQKGSLGQKVLEALGFDEARAQELLASEKSPQAS